MKRLSLVVLAAILLTARTARAQAAVNSDTSVQAAKAAEAAAEPVQSPSPPIPVEPQLLIPPNTLPGPDSSSLPQPPASPELQLLNALFKQTTMGKTADESRLHLQMAELEVRLRNDEELHALKAYALNARTDLEKRHRLRKYYETYYKKLTAMASTPELKDYLSLHEAGRTLILLQPRTRHKTDEAEATALLVKRTALTVGALPAPSQAPVNNILPRD